MKKKKYLWIFILFFSAGISILLYALSTSGLFDKNKILVQALACKDCPEYGIIAGGYKLSAQLPDSAKGADITGAFLTGVANPDVADYTKTYDRYLITGSLNGTRRVTENGPQYPVIIVSEWQEINLDRAWVYGFAVVLFLVLSIIFFRRFINANKESILQSSITLQEEIPG